MEHTKEKTLTILNNRPDNANDEAWKHFILGYYVSNIGRVYSTNRDIILNTWQNQNKSDKLKEQKHLCFEVCDRGRSRKIFVHKAVYFLFGSFTGTPCKYDLMLPRSKWKIHHIDSNPHNNHISNLYLMLDKWHTRLTMQLVHGKIKLSDVDTADKLDQWVMLNTDALQWFTDDKNK